MEQRNPSESVKSRVLIVDDNVVNLKMLRTYIESMGLIADVAEDGYLALEHVEKEIPDLILLDVMMPGLDGFEVCSMIKSEERSRHIPIIFVTALSEEKDEEKGFLAGGVDYITKPISRPVLEARVKTHLELKRHREKLQDLVEERSRALDQKTNELAAKEMVMRNLFEAMGQILATRDHYTFEHVLRVAEISARIGKVLCLSADVITAIELGCLIHDIGKVAIPDDILLKPGRFDPQDMRIMQYHPDMGATLFAKYIDDVRIKEIILHHHERLDGTGYPVGLKGDQIPIHVRIVAVADVFEALIARRPYKPPMTREKALSILYGDAEKGMMDPGIVNALEKVTESWDPREISRDFVGDYVNDLEMFRRMSYFREPLSDFFNYKYMLFLDDLNLLRKPDRPYHIILTDFLHMRQFNEKVGYSRVDEILLGIGNKLQEVTMKYNNSSGSINDNPVMLFRKGANYLIYSEFEGDHLDKFVKELEKSLNDAVNENNLEVRFLTKYFEQDCLVKNALDEIFMREIKPASSC